MTGTEQTDLTVDLGSNSVKTVSINIIPASEPTSFSSAEQKNNDNDNLGLEVREQNNEVSLPAKQTVVPSSKKVIIADDEQTTAPKNNPIQNPAVEQAASQPLQSEDSTRIPTPQDTRKQVLVPIANQSDLTETICITDTLSRFGANVVMASVESSDTNIVTLSQGVQIVANMHITEAEAQDWDLIACPGGFSGTHNLQKSNILMSMLQKQNSQKKMIGAIGSAPATVLKTAGVLNNGATCYPKQYLLELLPKYVTKDIAVNEHIVTSAGPGTALIFALKLGEFLYSKEIADDLAKKLVVVDQNYHFQSAPAKSITKTPQKRKQVTEAQIKKPRKKKKVRQTPQTKETKQTPRKVSSDNGEIKKKSPKKKETKDSTGKAISANRQPNKSLKKKETKKTPDVNVPTRWNVKLIFDLLLWPRLKKLGFKMESGKRPNDKYYFPPGITRKNGKLRVDFFDSVLGVIRYMEGGTQWQDLLKFNLECTSRYHVLKKFPRSGSLEQMVKDIEVEVIKQYPKFANESIIS